MTPLGYRRRPPVRRPHPLGSRDTSDIDIKRRYPLVDPSTRRVRNGRVVDLGVDAHTGVPFAMLEFGARTKRSAKAGRGKKRAKREPQPQHVVAVDRLRLIGRSLGEQREALRAMHEKAARQVEQALGLKVVARVHTQREDTFIARHPGAAAAGLTGLAHELLGQVWLERDWHAFLPVQRIHENLHMTESRQFTIDVSKRPALKLWVKEGITHYLTKVVCERVGERFRHVADYREPVRFAARLADIIGLDRLVQIYSEGRVTDLRRAVNRRLGVGTFQRAISALEAGDLKRALALLEVERRK